MTDYKLVPVEPTTEMESEGMLSLCGSIGGYESGLVQKCWHAMLAAAPAVQGEPVGWQCVWPDGGTFTADSYESAKHYQEGAISSHGEDQAPFIRPLFDDPKPAEQQPAQDVAELVEALEEIASWVAHPVATIAHKALAAHRNQQEGQP